MRPIHHPQCTSGTGPVYTHKNQVCCVQESLGSQAPGRSGSWSESTFSYQGLMSRGLVLHNLPDPPPLPRQAMLLLHVRTQK